MFKGDLLCRNSQSAEVHYNRIASQTTATTNIPPLTNKWALCFTNRMADHHFWFPGRNGPEEHTNSMPSPQLSKSTHSCL